MTQTPTFEAMAQYIAERLDASQLDAIYTAVRHFYLCIRAEEIKMDAEQIKKGAVSVFVTDRSFFYKI